MCINVNTISNPITPKNSKSLYPLVSNENSRNIEKSPQNNNTSTPIADKTNDLNNKFDKSNNDPVSISVSNLFNKSSSGISKTTEPTLPKNTITRLGTTTNGATVYSHNDAARGNNRVTTDYLCGHVFRTTSEMKGTNNLSSSGFIHMGVCDDPDPAKQNEYKNQYFDVLGTGIRGSANNLRNKDNITIMVTGFTPFPGVDNNPTSRFLLGNGTDTGPSALGFKPPVAADLDNMMRQQYTNFVKEPEAYYVNVNGQQIEAGRTYTVIDPETNRQRTINLVTARLPVDVDFRDGDDTGRVLRESISAANPDAVLSFGAGTPGNSNYYVETRSYGVTGAGNRITVTGGENFRYGSSDQFITNNDFSNIYRRQLRQR